MEFMSYAIVSNDFRRAGAASRSIKEHLKRVGADAEAVRRTMIAAYEAEMNVVIHSVGGRLEACLSESRIDVDVLDEGPGIANVEQAMVTGFSTAGPEARALGFGAGMGLPNIKRNSDRLRVTSRVGEGTRVSFTVRLKPANTGEGRLPAAASLHASADRCRDCRACLTACPTQAMRVRDTRPGVLEHLCIECTECIGACTSGALGIREDIISLEDVECKEEMLLVVPPALLAGCGPDVGPSQVLSALKRLGFADVVSSAPFERALLEAAAGTSRPSLAPTMARGDTGASAAGTVRAPAIVPSCPAVVGLIELRFPSLVPNLVPFDSPWEAVQATYGHRPVAYVVSCPAQRTALLAQARSDVRAEYLSPEVVRQAVMALLTSGTTMDCAAPGVAVLGGAAPGGAARGETAPGGTSGDEAAELLTVTGARHVTSILEDLENGLLGDTAVVDPYACEGGCFGSPLLAEDYHVAAWRYRRRGGPTVAETTAPLGPATFEAVPRQNPYAPRPGIRLDADMGRAIEKLAELQRAVQALPGRDCGACGAPTCASLAEDIVMDRAAADLCPYAATSSADEEA
jgi:anti-sigma regulatory factor (Ser/Thr protein kinase)/Na+-translocating ferredoxin:NAD+ oxidoreductase RNF subunit RnfB